jgi:hypothetical protein
MCLRTNCRPRIRRVECSIAVVLFLFSLALPVWGQVKSSAQINFDLAKVIPDPVLSGGSGSVAFLNEKLIGVCWHTEGGDNVVYFLALDGSTLRALGSGLPVEHQFFIHRVDDEKVLITGWIYLTSQILSARMRTIQSVPFITDYLVSPSGTIAGHARQSTWTVYQLQPRLQQLRSGSGTLLSVSDEKIAIRKGDLIQIESLKGEVIGMFAVKPPSKCATEVNLLPKSVYLATCNRNSLVDWNGKELLRLHPPKGDSLHIKMNEDGTRMLFDESTRHVSALQTFGEISWALVSLGMGFPDQPSNGEAVRVIDSASGSVCFDWKTPLSGAATIYNHSDLSPSGQSVAVLAGTSLNFYHLPDKCGSH